MYRYKKLMIGLNQDENDSLLIQYAGFVSKMAQSTEIYFVHVLDTLNIPDDIKKQYPEVLLPNDETSKNKMKESVEKCFDGYNKTKFNYEVVEGPLIGTLISRSKSNDIDLMIVGHSREDKSSGHYLSEKLARKAFCSVLILPKNTSVRLDNVLVALDFSDHCLNSLDVGSAFAKAAELDSIDLIHTFRVPEGYYKTGKDYDQFAGIMLDNAKTKLRQLISRADLKGLGIKPYFKMKDDVVKGILECADEKSSSLIVVGARGRSGDIAFILLGSVTEGLIRNLRRPLLAVKKKGEGLNIIDALFST